MFKGSTQVAEAFANGEAKSQGFNQSTGEALYYHGNKIAEWKEDGLYISNGGYLGKGGATGSKTTKDKLNALPKVNLYQKNFNWYLNGSKWDGEWIKVEGVVPPTIDKSKAGDIFLAQIRYVKTDGWRGYSEPQFAVVGVSDTGGWEDSPCPSHVAESELNAITSLLKKHKIRVKKISCETSNVFCMHHYLIPQLKNVEKARELAKNYLDNSQTRLLFVVS